MTTDRLRRLAVFEADYGRRTDWWIELEGRRVGRLTDAGWVEMFWWHYRIDVEGFGDDARRIVDDLDLWQRCKLTFRSVPFDVPCTHAFCGGDGPAEGAVAMRGLCVDISQPTRWERVLLWRRRRSRSKVSLEPVP